MKEIKNLAGKDPAIKGISMVQEDGRLSPEIGFEVKAENIVGTIYVDGEPQEVGLEEIINLELESVEDSLNSLSTRVGQNEAYAHTHHPAILTHTNTSEATLYCSSFDIPHKPLPSFTMTSRLGEIVATETTGGDYHRSFSFSNSETKENTAERLVYIQRFTFTEDYDKTQVSLYMTQAWDYNVSPNKFLYEFQVGSINSTFNSEGLETGTILDEFGENDLPSSSTTYFHTLNDIKANDFIEIRIVYYRKSSYDPYETDYCSPTIQFAITNGRIALPFYIPILVKEPWTYEGYKRIRVYNEYIYGSSGTGYTWSDLGVATVYINGKMTSATNYHIPAGSYILFMETQGAGSFVCHFNTEGGIPGYSKELLNLENGSSTHYSLKSIRAHEATGPDSTALGIYTLADSGYSLASGYGTATRGDNSFSSGKSTLARGVNSIVGGYETIAGSHSLAVGSAGDIIEKYAEGYIEQYSETKSSKDNYMYGVHKLPSSISVQTSWIGKATAYFYESQGGGSHDAYPILDVNTAENTIITVPLVTRPDLNQYVIIANRGGVAYGTASMVSGRGNEASAQYSQAFGEGTITSRAGQLVQGRFNAKRADALHIVGNGSSNDDRKNVYVLDTQGNAEYAGKVSVGQAPAYPMDVATKQYVDEHVPDITVENATATTAGVLKVRLDETTNTLYITNDGSNA